MDRKLWLLAFFLLASVSFLGATANAIDESIWMRSGDATKTLIEQKIVESTNEKFCSKHIEYELEHQILFGKRVSQKKNPIEACWFTTSYGLIGVSIPSSRTYIKVKDRSDAVTRLLDNTYIWMSLGQTNSMAYKYYQSSFSHSLYIYGDITGRLTLQQDGSYDSYSLNRSSNPWRLQYPDGNTIGVNEIASSQNGEWMLVEGGGGFFRLNTYTKDILMFDSAMYGYGYGANPTHELAISNDGRYAIVGGGAIDSKIAFIYDLSTCQPLADRFKPSNGCGKRNFKRDFFPELPNNRSPFMFRFSSDAESVSVNSLDGTGMHDKYLITAPGKAVHSIEYLALGDSYTSGEGEYEGDQYYLPGTDGNGLDLDHVEPSLNYYPYNKEKCHLSTRSYPYNLALSSRITANQYSSVACSGSTTNDITNVDSAGLVDKRYNGRYEQFKDIVNPDIIVNIKLNAIDQFIPGRAAQIEFVKKYKPKVATIGIGGNDLEFSNKIKDCSVPVYTCGWANDLRYAAGNDAQINLYKDLNTTYKALKDASQATTFIAIGYPNIFSYEDDICAPNVWLNKSEREFARQYVKYINQVIEAAANNNKIAYIDIEESLQGDRLCDASFDGKAVQGLVYGTDKAIWIPVQMPTGTVWTYVGVNNESYHPTHIGHERIASSIASTIAPANIVSYSACPSSAPIACFPETTTAPTLPDYFTSYGTPNIEVSEQVKMTESAYTVEERPGLESGETIDLENSLSTDGGKFKPAPSQSATVTMHSTPRQVGTLNVDSNGVISGSITIPEDAEPGYHTLVVNIKDSLYRNAMVYQSIFVYDTLDDFDGDGVQNVDEKCGLVEPINQDEDRDGTDDACDGVISEPPDTTPPVVTSSVTVEPNVHGWYNQAVVVNWAASDDKDTEIVAPASLTASQEGEHTYTSPEVCDAAGNCATGSVTLKIDTVPPVVFNLLFSKNPKAVGESSILSSDVSDASSGIVESEYFIADDPGVGNGATMTLDGQYISTSFGTDFGTGVYTISARAQDRAGNWSLAPSDYLVVYDTTSGVRLRGARTLSLNEEDNQLPWATTSSASSGKFAFSVRYGNDGVITKQSDFQFAYKTGENCHSHKVAKDCHKFELNATRIAWLTTGGVNHSYGVFRGDGQLTVDGQSQPVQFVVHGVDGERMSPYDEDQFSLTIYPSSGSEPMYFVAPTSLSRGDIKIRF